MNDLVYFAAGVVASAPAWLSGGLAFGRRVGRRNERKAIATADPVEPKPICGCKHHYALHYRQQGEERCGHVAVERVLIERGQPRQIEVERGASGWVDYKIAYDHEKWEMVERACSCVHYTGPEPLPTYVSNL